MVGMPHLHTSDGSLADIRLDVCIANDKLRKI